MNRILAGMTFSLFCLMNSTEAMDKAKEILSPRDRNIADIGAHAAKGDMTGTGSQLDSHIRIGRHNGLSDGQIESVLAIARAAARDDAFPKGEAAPAHFTGKAWVAMLANNKDYDMSSYNVTFAPGARNDWHSHTVGQVLFCTTGAGYYQERGKAARRLAPGDVVEIPAHTEHWHGAAPDNYFTHIGVTPKMASNETNWGSLVTDEEYQKATEEK